MAWNYKFQQLTIFTKSFILDVWLGPEYAPESYFFNICLNLRYKSISEVFLNISRFNMRFERGSNNPVCWCQVDFANVKQKVRFYFFNSEAAVHQSSLEKLFWKSQKQTPQRCSVKEDDLKNFANFTIKHLCRSFFLIKFRPATLLKKKLQHRCFPLRLAKSLRTPVLKNTSVFL